LAAGYVPILTHPERLAWIERSYALIEQLARSGIWMQLTAGSVLGQFGSRARYWSERLLDDGLVHIMASDGHGVRGRRPVLREARAVVAKRIGEEGADHLVLTRPRAVLDDVAPGAVVPPEPVAARNDARRMWRRVPRKERT
jgi:protein-tyrosine phosphatase